MPACSRSYDDLSVNQAEVASGLKRLQIPHTKSRAISPATLCSTMGANLLDLPDEVLVCVFSALQILQAKEGDDRSKSYLQSRLHRNTLCSLALMNRRLHNIIYPTLLEDVRLSVRAETRHWSNHIGMDSLLDETPNSLDSIRHFRIYWNSRTPDSWARDLFKTVATISGLITFTAVGFSDKQNLKSDYALIEPLIAGLQDLQSFVLDVDCFDMTASWFLKICSLPQLQDFRTSSRIYGAASLRNTIAFPNYCVGTQQHTNLTESNLTCLRCSGEYLDLEMLRLALARAPRMVELHITLPGPGVVSDVGVKPLGGRSAPNPSAAYRPSLVTESLLPASQTLERLTCVNHEVATPFHDGSIINLNPFQSLISIKISARLLCRAEIYQDLHRHEPNPLPSPNWYRSLPSALQILEIYFDYAGGLFWSKADLETLDGYTHLSPYYADVSEISNGDTQHLRSMRIDFSRRVFEPKIAEEIETGSRLRWIRELIKNRFEHVSYLSSFKVIETPKIGRRQRRPWGQLDLAIAYPETFGGSDVDLGLVVRTPPGYTAPPFTAVRS